MARWGQLLAMIPFVLVTAACGPGGGTHGSGSTSGTSGGASSGATASSSASTSSPTAKYAALVAQQKQAMAKPMATLTGPQCSLSGIGIIDNNPGSSVCTMSLETVQFQAGSLTMTLNGAAKPGTPTYVGAPPADLAKLVATTTTAATALATAAQNADTCATKPGPTCGTRFGVVKKALGDMQAQFAAWAPYGVS